MSIPRADTTTWPNRDLQFFVNVQITALSEYAIEPTTPKNEDFGMEVYSVYTCTIERFSTIQVPTDLRIEFPAGVTGKIIPRIPPQSHYPHSQVNPGVIPSQHQDTVSVSVSNWSEDRLVVQRGWLMGKILPQTYYQPVIIMNKFKPPPEYPQVVAPPSSQMQPPPPYGHQLATSTAPPKQTVATSQLPTNQLTTNQQPPACKKQ